jgi:hypothetical protein
MWSGETRVTSGLGPFLPAVALCGVALGTALHPPIEAVVVAGLLVLAAAAAPLLGRAGGGGARRVSVSSHELERHLAWFRRREEPGTVLVVRIPARTDAGRVRAAFRITDSVATATREGDLELTAVLDRTQLDPEGLERRLTGIAGLELDFGWAHFPEDGVTLPGLLERAREDLPIVTTPARADSAPARSRTVTPRVSAELSHQTGGVR